MSVGLGIPIAGPAPSGPGAAAEDLCGTWKPKLDWLDAGSLAFFQRRGQCVQENISATGRHIPAPVVAIMLDFLAQKIFVDDISKVQNIVNFLPLFRDEKRNVRKAVWKNQIAQAVTDDARREVIYSAEGELSNLVEKEIEADSVAVARVQTRTVIDGEPEDVQICSLQLICNQEDSLDAAIEPFLCIRPNGADFYFFYNRSVYHIRIKPAPPKGKVYAPDPIDLVSEPDSDFWDLYPHTLRSQLEQGVSRHVLVGCHGSNTQLFPLPTFGSPP